MAVTVERVLERADAGLEQSRAALFELLRIPSVSAQPARAPDCVAAAEWLRDRFAAMGFEASLRPTAGQPVMLAHRRGPAGAPHLLYYGHYDVQPAEPLELWTQPAFDPAFVDGPDGKRVVARGAVDDKGQVMTIVEAFRAWHETAGALPVTVTVLLEGEEEVGSVNLDSFLAANRAELAADVAVISDTGMWDIDTPALTTRLRGMLYTQVDVHGPSRDLHSGMYGGSAANPLTVLSRLLGALHDPDGRVRVPGFYDGVEPVPERIASQWEALGFDEAAFLGEIGLSVPVGERGVPALQRLWARPTAEVNGIWGGYAGDGAKTVIPAEAHAKVSFRLVAGQAPDAVLDGFRRFVAEHLPAGVRAEVTALSGSPAMEVPADGPWTAAATAALVEEFGREPVLIGCGGSIPVVGSLKAILGLDTVLMGFGLDDDGPHSPDEKFEWACFRRGVRSHIRLLGRLG